MAEVLTTKLKNDTLRLFQEDVANSEFYFTVSSIALEERTTVSAVNSQYSKNQFKENIIFGKMVDQDDIKFMIKYYPWQKDQVYVQYDDQVDLENQRFYAVVGPNNNDSGDYRVYKCLNNNNGAASTAPPNYNSETDRQIYQMPDGYVWKFMYYLTEQEFEAYNAVGYIPLTGNFEINPANTEITGSTVSSIIVENPVDNNGYPAVDNILVESKVLNDQSFRIRNDSLSRTNNFYSGMTFFVTVPDTEESFSYEIDTYTWKTGQTWPTIKVKGDPFGDGVVQNATGKIVPTVKIKGDGTGCEAIPKVVDGRIKTIEILDNGDKNYTNVTAEIIDPPLNFNPEDTNTIDIRAKLRPVLSPVGDHNYNLIDELHCRHILMYAYMTEADSNKVAQSNSFSAVALMKDMEFGPDPANTQITESPTVFDNRIKITTNDYGKVEVNTLVKQIDVDNNTTFEARVHAIQASSNSIFLCSYMGPYTNYDDNDIPLDPDKDLINETGQRLKINTPVANNIVESRYTQRSGTIYFMEDFVPLERTKTSREEYKLVLEI